MDWRDEGVLLTLRRHGEGSALLSVFTRDHGRHAGLVRGAFTPRMRGALQPGNRLMLSWRARLAEHLGYFAVEPLDSAAAALMPYPGRLAALVSAAALVETGFPERAPQPDFFDRLIALIASLNGEHWAVEYALWEVELLAALGFGLDLRRCALTGRAEGLAFVSPVSGRAVCREAAAPWRDRLLPLPPFLLSGARGDVDISQIVSALRLTGRFLERHLFAPHDRAQPPARRRLLDYLLRRAEEERKA